MEEEEMKVPKHWLLLQWWDVYSVLVICNLEFRLDVNLLCLLPGRMHTFSVSHPPQPTYLSLSHSLGLSLILSWGTCPLFATLILPHLTSVLFFKKFLPVPIPVSPSFFWSPTCQNLTMNHSYRLSCPKHIFLVGEIMIIKILGLNLHILLLAVKHTQCFKISMFTWRTSHKDQFSYLLLTPTFPSHVNPVNFSPHQYHPSVLFE